MTHHLLPEIGRDWLDRLTSCFLIRDPREVLASYVRTRAEPTLPDVGLPQQVEIFEHVRRRTGRAPPVLDARDVLEDPRRMLGLAVRGDRHPLLGAHACLAGGPAPERRRLGQALVQERLALHRLLAVIGRPAARLAEALRPLAEACAHCYQMLQAHLSGPKRDRDRAVCSRRATSSSRSCQGTQGGA